jgi:flavin-dependent dehydrogenase
MTNNYAPVRFDYDCIVIGGGPAGSTFARYAANGGMNVLIVDKRKEIGAPVRCGEGLSQSEVQGRIPEDMPKRCISEYIVGAKVFAPNGKSIVWKDETTKGWVLERKFFDKWLCELAVEKGVKIRSYTRATELLRENGKIMGVRLSHGNNESYDVTAPLVISAEGMESMIARQAGFDTVHQLYDVGTCYEYEMKTVEHESMIELYFGNNIAPRGYCLTPDTEIIAKNTVKVTGDPVSRTSKCSRHVRDRCVDVQVAHKQLVSSKSKRLGDRDIATVRKFHEFTDIKPITDIKIGEEVLTLHGWMPVSDTSVREYDGEVIRVTPFMLNNTVGLTTDHLVFTWNKRKGFHWKKAGELIKSKRGDHRNGDYLVFPVPKEKEGSTKHIMIDEWIKEGFVKDRGYLYPKGGNQHGSEFKYKLKRRIKNKLEFSENLMELLGYFVSEGNVSRGAVIISNTDSRVIERVKNIGMDIFGFEPYIFEQKYNGKSKTCYQVQFTSMILRNLFKAMFGEGCANKKLPYFVHKLSRKQKLAILKGLYTGDGSKWKASDGNDVVSYVSISKTLIYDIWMLLAGIGIIGAIKKNKKKNAYEIRIRGKQIIGLGDTFNDYKTGDRKNRGFFMIDNYILVGIRKLERERYKGKVYDIESAGSFCPSFAVHNCWMFPKADKRANVGIGIGGHLTDGVKNGGIKGATPKEYLDRFIQVNERFRNASTLMDFGGVISVGAPIKECVKDNMMVIGTAAKQVDPIHGGGIYLAIEAGRIAAGVALNAFGKKDFSRANLIGYEKLWAEGEGKKCMRRLLLRKALEKLNDDDLNHIVGSITASDLNAVMEGKFAGPVAKVLAGRPQLMKALGALIA